MRVTIERHDRTINTTASIDKAGIRAPYHDDEIIDLTQPQKAPKQDTTLKKKETKSGKVCGKTGGKSGKARTKPKGTATEAFPQSQQWDEYED